MLAQTHTHTHKCTDTQTHTHKRAHTHTYIHARTHIHMHTLTHRRAHTHAQARTHTRTQIEGGQEDYPLTHFVPCHNIKIFLQNSFIYNIKYSIASRGAVLTVALPCHSRSYICPCIATQLYNICIIQFREIVAN